MLAMMGKPRNDFTVPLQPVSSLAGKSFVVVGGTSGVGQAIAKEAAAKGAEVTVVGRSFKDADVPGLKFVQKDLTSMKDAAELGKELPPANYTVFTTGTLAPKQRQETSEGLERDMAVSCLSRLVILRELAPRLPPGSRVFVYGMPGNGEDVSRLDDINSEKEYGGGFGFTHMNTVAGNEAIVHLLAAQPQYAGRVSFFGMNPGLLPTDIRTSMGEGGLSALAAYIIEPLIGFFAPKMPVYARTMVELMAAPGLEAHSGAMFGQKGTPILPNKRFTQDPACAAAWYAGMEALLKSKVGI